jgi:predicted HAD superfamily Cof-like phosphohydrolase
MKQYNQVKEFHKAFGHPVNEKPVLMDKDRINARAKWMVEEIVEFGDAKDITEQADALTDLLYFVLGTFVEIGVDPEPIFDIVQKANMSKLWPDGKPRYREDNKVLKPDGWEPPEPKIELEIENQLNNEK